jgi:hypothetical protein
MYIAIFEYRVECKYIIWHWPIAGAMLIQNMRLAAPVPFLYRSIMIVDSWYL